MQPVSPVSYECILVAKSLWTYTIKSVSVAKHLDMFTKYSMHTCNNKSEHYFWSSTFFFFSWKHNSTLCICYCSLSNPTLHLTVYFCCNCCSKKHIHAHIQIIPTYQSVSDKSQNYFSTHWWKRISWSVIKWERDLKLSWLSLVSHGKASLKTISVLLWTNSN